MTQREMDLLLRLEASIRENYRNVDQETRVVLDDLEVVRASIQAAKAQIARSNPKATHGQRFRR